MTPEEKRERARILKEQERVLWDERHRLEEELERDVVEEFLNSGLLSRIAWKIDIHLNKDGTDISRPAISPVNKPGFEPIGAYEPKPVFDLVNSDPYHCCMNLVLEPFGSGYPVATVRLQLDDGHFYITFETMEHLISFVAKYDLTIDMSPLDEHISQAGRVANMLREVQKRINDGISGKTNVRGLIREMGK